MLIWVEVATGFDLRIIHIRMGSRQPLITVIWYWASQAFSHLQWLPSKAGAEGRGEN